MYAQSYHNKFTREANIPPNYSGNAFNRQSIPVERSHKHTYEQIPIPVPPKKPIEAPIPIKEEVCDSEEAHEEHKEIEPASLEDEKKSASLLGSLGNFGNISSEELLLLTLLLLCSDSEKSSDLTLLILLLLFIK